MVGLLLFLIYLCFISLGLPDSLLGSAWPIMHSQINVPVSYAGVLSMCICSGTILSALFSNKLLVKFGTGKVTAFSIALTALGLLGFSASNSFLLLVLFTIPYGLGAGGVDAILNNYVALHYKPQHMSWLHCMWGVGASISPFIMSFSLVSLNNWHYGYLIVGVIQAILCASVFASIPIWNKAENTDDTLSGKSLTFREIFRISGAFSCFLLFFSYCALEVTASLWASSYLVQSRGVDPETAAAFASMFYIGLTAGRAVNGFLAMKLSDRILIRSGLFVIGVGLILIVIPCGTFPALSGFVITGLGCAPIYPCIIHMTPDVFGKDNSQAMIGIQMAFAYTGILFMPSLFGFISDYASISLLPAFLALFLITMIITHEKVIGIKKTPEQMR